MKLDSTRRLMAVERSRTAYETLYGAGQVPHYSSSVELDAFAERMSRQPSPDIDRVAILGYN